MRWFGHVQRREEEHIGRRVMMMKPPGRRRRGRPKRRFMGAVRDAMREEDVGDRQRWTQMIHCSDP